MSAEALAEALAAGEGPVARLRPGGQRQHRRLRSARRDRRGDPRARRRAGSTSTARSASGRRRRRRCAALVDGAEGADSWSVDAHKWLNVPYDSALGDRRRPRCRPRRVRGGRQLPARVEGREPGEYVPEMSRRARAVPVYAALRSLGRSGLVELIERCCSHARRLERAIAGLDGAEVLNDVVLNQVMVRFGDDDETTGKVAEHVRESGEAWVGGTDWRGRVAVRVSFSNWSTTDEDVDRLVAAFRLALGSLEP